MAADRDVASTRLATLLVRLRVGREAFKDGASGLAVEGGQLVGTFVFFVLLSRQLGPTDYGSFAAMYSLIGISLALAHIGPGLAFLQHAMGAPVRSVAANFFTSADHLVSSRSMSAAYSPPVLSRSK